MPVDNDLARYAAIMERFATAYRLRMVQVCKEADLTPPQFWALSTIRRLSSTKMSPLADSLGLSMGAASTLVDRLVTRGLVERTADAHDRRAVHVNLSAKGQAVLAEAEEAKRHRISQVFEQLGPETRSQLINGLGALLDAWEALPPDFPDPGLGACSLEG